MVELKEVKSRIVAVLRRVGELEIWVDEEDYQRFNSYKWTLTNRDHTHYAHTRFEGRIFYLHRAVLRIPYGDKRHVDHRDHNGLNCCKWNLRLATHKQNAANTRWDVIRPSKTGYIGVHETVRGTFVARTRGPTGERLHLGTFKNAKDAAIAYDAYQRQKSGEFARLNFPEGTDDERSGQCIVGGSEQAERAGRGTEGPSEA